MSFTVLQPRTQDVPIVKPDKVQELEGRVANVEQSILAVVQSVEMVNQAVKGNSVGTSLQ